MKGHLALRLVFGFLKWAWGLLEGPRWDQQDILTHCNRILMHWESSIFFPEICNFGGSWSHFHDCWSCPCIIEAVVSAISCQIATSPSMILSNKWCCIWHVIGIHGWSQAVGTWSLCEDGGSLRSNDHLLSCLWDGLQPFMLRVIIKLPGRIVINISPHWRDALAFECKGLGMVLNLATWTRALMRIIVYYALFLPSDLRIPSARLKSYKEEAMEAITFFIMGMLDRRWSIYPRSNCACAYSIREHQGTKPVWA